MSEPSLPAARRLPPACGACGVDTERDHESFVCESCGLRFDRTSLAASYLDQFARPCGQPCSNWWHGDDRIQQGVRFECGSCVLPAGHESGHWTGCTRKPEAGPR